MDLYNYFFNKILGWKIVGGFNADEIKKCVIIVHPHTSWHDFYIGVFVRKLQKISINFVGKKELFIWPFGYYFRWMGGAPLDRSKNQNKVDSIAAIFNSKKEFRLAMAPEGTRKKVKKWRTGFYYIALKAKVPIIPVSFDYNTKTVIINEPFYPTGDIESDIKKLREYYVDVQGKVVGNHN